MGQRRWQLLSSLPIAGLLWWGGIPPALALVPYVYLPQTKELEGAGLGIAQAAARLLRLGQAEDAARLAELSVQLLPDDPRSWVLLAEALLRSNDSSKALLALAQAKRLDPTNAGIWFAEGSLALRRGNPGDALQLLRRGLQLDGRNSGAYFDLGNASLLLGRPTEALTAFEKASRLRGDFWEAVNNQGLVLFELDRPREAIERWRKVLTIKPDAAETSLALATALYESNPQKRSEALQLAEHALNTEPSYVHETYQKEQLWGVKLRAATSRLLALPELKVSVDRAAANATDQSKDDENP